MPNRTRRPLRLSSWRSIMSGGLIFAASAMAAAGAAESASITTLKPGTLQVCLYGGFAPFAYKENGAWTGWDVDYLTAFARANKLALEVVEEPQFEGVWLRPGEGKCDIAGSGISDTAERRTESNAGACWSSNYYGVLRSFLVRKADVAKLSKVEDLKGRTAIVTKGSTADFDLCNRMQVAGMKACTRPDGDRACPNVPQASRTSDPACVSFDYPRDDSEANAAREVAGASGPDGAFTYGGGYGSIETLAKQMPSLALTWPHCNMAADGNRMEDYAEPFAFVVSSRDTGLLKALNAFIAGGRTPYAGTPIPDLACKAPPWTLAPPSNPDCRP